MDHPDVVTLSQQFKTVKQPDIQLPESLDGRIVWADFLTPVRNQGSCGSCWAYSSSESLSDRYAIWTLGQLRVNLSGYDMVICDNVINSIEYKPNVASAT